MEMYPLKFEPIFKHRIWGGQKLAEIFGKDLGDGKKIGESWELADLPEDKSVIANGELKGLTLAEAIEKYPKEITGDENFEGPFPLLIKILDAQDVLSVQVHPDEEACKRLGKGDPKTECWYIISAVPGAVIYKGLKKGVTKKKFAKAIKAGSVDKLLAKIEVTPGQCHFLPSGTAHAIGAGILIAEIQLPSDTTYRVFDWNRVDDAGNPRQLHIAEALESIHFDSSADELSVTTMGRLVDSKYFKIDKGHQAQHCEVLLSSGPVSVFVILTGGGVITAKTGDCVFKAGDCVLTPASFEGVMKFAADTEYLIVSL